HHRHDGEWADHLVVVGGTGCCVHVWVPIHGYGQNVLFSRSGRRRPERISEASMGKAQRSGIDGDQYPHTASGQGEWLWNRPEGEATGTLILAHGAGAPMDSPFMEEIAQRLAARGLAVVRFEFPYMAARRLGGGKRPPNPQAQLLESWRQVYRAVRHQVTGPLAI